jgi:predicted DNA-binding transcriptional regulator AlpA
MPSGPNPRPSTTMSLLRTSAVYLTVTQVLTLIGVSYTTLWRWQAQGRFPYRRKLGPNRVGFLRTEVEEWIQSRPQIRGDDFHNLD